MENRIKILMSGVSKMNPAGAFKAHRHPYYQLNHILRGVYDYMVDSRIYRVGEGDTVLIPMNRAHSITQVEGEAGYYFEVKFSTFSSRDKEICDEAGIVLRADDFSPKLMKEIFDEDEHPVASSEEIKTTYLYALLYKISAKGRRMKSIPSKYIEVEPYSEPIRDIIRFLEDNYAKHLSLDDIVKETTLKKSALCGRFKQETSMTIFECMMIIRIRKAVELLSFTELSLAQISEMTGFVSLTHFNRVFTKHVMIPPGQYRKHLASQTLYWNDAVAIENASPIAVAALENTKINFAQLAVLQA
jgi:AraC-like DNA-binding protein